MWYYLRSVKISITAISSNTGFCLPVSTCEEGALCVWLPPGGHVENFSMCREPERLEPGELWSLSRAPFKVIFCLAHRFFFLIKLLEVPLWHRLQLWRGFDPWPGNFHMPWGLAKKKKKKKKKKKNFEYFKKILKTREFKKIWGSAGSFQMTSPRQLSS